MGALTPKEGKPQPNKGSFTLAARIPHVELVMKMMSLLLAQVVSSLSIITIIWTERCYALISSKRKR
jgi:hypothetical protein